MSDTPETDAAAFDAFDGQGGEVIFTDLARRFERERNKAEAGWLECRNFAQQMVDERDEVRAKCASWIREWRGLRDLCRQLDEDANERLRERDQARRELDIQLESIKFHMERVPVREHPLRADDAPLQDSGAEPQPLREGEPSDFCGAIRRMRDAERERNSLQDQRDFCMGEIERLRKEAAQKDKLLAEVRAAIRWVADDNCKGWLL